MKVAVMIFRNGVSPRLDIADSLWIYDMDEETGNVSQSETCSLDVDQPGQLVSFLRQKGISTILCGGCPRFSWRMLSFYGIDVLPGLMGDPGDLVNRLAAGNLSRDLFCDLGGRGCCGSRVRFRRDKADNTKKGETP
jgi:predicted Fe-Mo cluster-binding NifX family protein